MEGRELKFRFWLGHTSKMTYAHSLEEIFKLGWELTKDIIPMQYSGIKDNHGQEIYEGDVISWNVKTDEAKDKRLSAVVAFEDGCFMAAGRPLIMLFSFNVISDITVDTNIHESPELV